jgi:hypothetical protein
MPPKRQKKSHTNCLERTVSFKKNENEEPFCCGDYEFIITNMFETNMSYLKIVEIVSRNKVDDRGECTFYVYQSNSEIGVWRLYYTLNSSLIDDDLLIEKGSDYTQSTCIHPCLQVWINEQVTGFHTESQNRFQLCETIHEENEKEIRTYNIKSFKDILTAIDSYDYDTVSQDLTPHLNKFLTKLDGIILSKYREPCYAGIRNIIGSRRNPIINSDREIRTYGLFNKLDLITKCGDDFNKETLDDLHTFLEDLKKSYTYVSLEKLGIYTYDLDNSIPFNITMCKLTLATTDTPDTPEIDIYLNITKGHGVKIYYNVILITLHNTGCNHLGLPNNYIPSGIFVCKVLEYKQQDEGEIRGLSINSKYNFVGNVRKLYKFPFITDDKGKIGQKAKTIIDGEPSKSSCCNVTSAIMPSISESMPGKMPPSSMQSMSESMPGKTGKTPRIGGKKRSKKIRQRRQTNKKNKRINRHNKNKTIKRYRYRYRF